MGLDNNIISQLPIPHSQLSFIFIRFVNRVKSTLYPPDTDTSVYKSLTRSPTTNTPLTHFMMARLTETLPSRTFLLDGPMPHGIVLPVGSELLPTECCRNMQSSLSWEQSVASFLFIECFETCQQAHQQLSSQIQEHRRIPVKPKPSENGSLPHPKALTVNHLHRAPEGRGIVAMANTKLLTPMWSLVP